MLLEAKLAGTPLDREQLISHARAWGIPHRALTDWDIDAPAPDGFALRTWGGVRAWLDELTALG